MKRLIAFALCLLVTLGGCEDTPESLLQEMMDQQRDHVKILQGITDEASAREAVPELKESVERARDIRDRAKALKHETSVNEMFEMERKYEKEMQELTELRTKEFRRLRARPELMKIISSSTAE